MRSLGTFWSKIKNFNFDFSSKRLPTICSMLHIMVKPIQLMEFPKELFWVCRPPSERDYLN